MSLEKIKSWTTEQGRRDITDGRTARENAVYSRVWGVVMDLDGVVPHQGAKVGKGGEHLDLAFGRMFEGRKTPELFCGVLARPSDDTWVRKGKAPEAGSVRLYVKLSEIACARSDWSDLMTETDAPKGEDGWRFFEIPDRFELDGDEILDLIEDSYFEIAGI